MPIKCFFTGDKLKGALYFLYNTYSDQYSQIVKASGECYSVLVPENAIDFNPSTIWHSKVTNQTGEYLQIDLKGYYMTLDAYSIQTSNLSPGNAHPKHWGFEASFDGISYSKRLDYVDEEGQMNSNSRIIILPVELPGKYKHFRLSVQGESHSTNDATTKIRMDISQIEFFGTLYKDSENLRNMCTSNQRIHRSLIFWYCLLGVY